MDPKTQKNSQAMEPKHRTKRIQKVLDLLKGLTFEPLNGFSNFKSLNDLEFCQQLI